MKAYQVPLIAGVCLGMVSTGVVANTNPADNAQYEKRFPKQYQSWEKTAESKEATNLLSADPNLVILWAGYGFAKDYKAPRGHQYAITDVRSTLRTGAPMTADEGPMPMACWSCKSPDVPRLIEEEGETGYFKGKWAKGGPEIVNNIGCADCHEPGTSKLRIARPFAERAFAAIGTPFDEAEKGQKQNMVCGQCHVEYYFEKTAEHPNWVKFPWDDGTKVEDMEAYYDKINFTDWTHQISKAPMLKAQHPGYETTAQGIHGEMGISCTDCHMPRVTNAEGKEYTDHNIGSPFDKFEYTCTTCHEQTKEQLQSLVQANKDKINALKLKAEDALVKAHFEAGAAWKAGATEQQMAAALTDIRHAQWRWDYAIASHGIAAHAPEEGLRILETSLVKSTEARDKLAKILAAQGVNTAVVIPDISTEAKAQAVLGMDMKKMRTDKATFIEKVVPKWEAEYKATNGE
ncbi:ammonia-forming cytochrome c nitrite reductase [Shewanella schlegeliana]|uniref:Cytochrome c-552 n=1 Tax=Shewanella schlegeliana TaxID=190308 RepID=A0ABS1T0K3_9GAMM|nr:ammonia-forming cytochrome c nitrite reductase [Shewanella schlegeliana]MBL4913367.1 ammonia-forming cytochrome c nitrite reductase [Shewanella schlegeliana]MCL1109322.1 ammonia-forming cytochrome c nitrite reductase [Shewanella schlegeliana]GIU38066.1 cytochrome c-552 [Shewanella schlegeliana]